MDDLMAHIYQAELNRVRFLIRAYYRTRLFKIEKYAVHVVKPETNEFAKLSPQEQEYAKNVKYIKGKGGGMVIFGIKSADARKAGSTFIDSLKLISHVANVGDARTLAIHPATTTHSQMNPEQQAAAGAPPDMVRLSIGLETAEDIIADIDQALEQAN